MNIFGDDFDVIFNASTRRMTHANRERTSISSVEKQKIAQYLENPVGCGLWHLNSAWLQGSGISSDIWTEIEREIKDKKTLIIRSGKRDRRITLSDEWKESLHVEVCSTLSFPLAFFDYLIRQEMQQPEVAKEFGAKDEDVQLVLDIIDINPIKQKYAEAFTFFKSRIWHQEFHPIIQQNKLIRLSHGTIILQQGPRKNAEISAIAWDSTPLRNFKEFLEKLGKTGASTLMPVFSPEEEVFKPYFDLLALAYDFVIPQSHLQPLIEKAMTNFSENNYADCVSAIGLASEDILTQIFETLYREQLTKGLTLGQLADELHARAANKFKKKDEPAPDLASLYPEIKAAVEDPDLTSLSAVELLRRFLTVTLEVNKHTNARIDRIGKPERRILIWPESVNHAVNELIRYRNAASHKSRIPIGPMECRRAAFSFVVLIRWWLNERMVIDWSKGPDEILMALLHQYAKP